MTKRPETALRNALPLLPIGLALFLGGTSVIVAAWMTVRDNEYLLDYGARAPGTIVEVQQSGEHIVWVPTVYFYDADGQAHIATGRGRSQELTVGSHLDVYYDPADREQVLVAGDERLWGWFAFVTFFGSIPLVAGVGALSLFLSLVRRPAERLQ